MKEAAIVMLAKRAKAASAKVAALDSKIKNLLLLKMAKALLSSEKKILEANRLDVIAAQKNNFAPAFIDRLTLTPKRLREMAKSLKAITRLSDPVGKKTAHWKTPAGLGVEKVRIPLGVIGMIYESRPDVTVDTAALCLKSGNTVILRGGSEAWHSNKILSDILRGVLKKNGVNPDIIQLMPPGHAAVKIILEQDKYIDLIIPRGGESLMKMVRGLSKIPVIRHDKGVCHIFVDRDADLKMAETICLNAKVQRPGTCNAMECLLVDQKIATQFLPSLLKKFKNFGVKVRRSSKDWGKEFLDLELALRVVPNIDAAMDHIQKYGSLHTESIITQNKKHAEKFLKNVLASVVMVNASTRLNDGFQLGLGSEVGISTTKLHAFGPMGLEELTTTKFVVRGQGQIRR
ncbi:MAG: glutamate-5-semialdehyde dehydrogenase [Deltaproteobacteria bacterium]|nr:glutamate-5-semialdehyde dehydrogenase [Deltaproteobacteria bacterium]